MKITNKTLMAEARVALAGKWGFAAQVRLIYTLVFMMFAPFSGLLFLAAGPLRAGFTLFSVNLAHKRAASIDNLFEGFKNFGTFFVTYILTTVLTLLWALLLIVPGIIAALSYSQTYFILTEHPSTGPLEAIRKSKEMMRGNKWKLFCLKLRFLGWGILSLLSLGIGFFWLIPYIYVTNAKFYEDIKNHH